MQEFFENIQSSVGIMDIIDILIVAYLIYRVLIFIRATRAEQLMKGLLVFVFAWAASEILNLHTLNWILKGIAALGAVALVVIFQQELRRGLEYLGRTKFFRGPGNDVEKDKAKHIVHEFVRAISNLSAESTGALIVIERHTALSELTDGATIIDAEISAELLGNLFYEGSPLHDGAVLIRNDKVHAAGCVLPLTRNPELGKELGTRHRAGIGVTEHSDALVLIVSEETGVISMASDGKLSRFLDTKSVEKALLQVYLEDEHVEAKKPGLPDFMNKIRGNDNAEK